LDVDLSRGLQIHGRNGTGKSSILEAIRFCFKETAAGYKRRIHHGERKAEVELSFSLEGSSYLIKKTIYVDKPSEATLLRNETLIADNPSSVHRSLGGILQEEVIENLLYVPQDGLTHLVENLTQKGGRQTLDSLFGLDRLEKVYAGIGDETKSLKAKLEIYEKQRAKYPDDFPQEYERLVKTAEAARERAAVIGVGHAPDGGQNEFGTDGVCVCRTVECHDAGYPK